MSSVGNQPPSGIRPNSFSSIFELWNRKLHYYIGLYLLFFVWLYSLTGLLLNHSTWQFQQFWPSRTVSAEERLIQDPAPAADLEQARELMRQFGIRGEITLPVGRPTSTRLEVRANRPGYNYLIVADLSQSWARLETTHVNGWGAVRALHEFIGASRVGSGTGRNWLVTSAWALSMDAVSLGLIVMVVGGYYLWWRLPRKRAWGVVALALGVLCCGAFVFGFRGLWF
jgi:hypothetical protein